MDHRERLRFLLSDVPSEEENLLFTHIEEVIDEFDKLYRMDTSHVTDCEIIVEGKHTPYRPDVISKRVNLPKCSSDGYFSFSID